MAQQGRLTRSQRRRWCEQLVAVAVGSGLNDTPIDVWTQHTRTKLRGRSDPYHRIRKMSITISISVHANQDSVSEAFVNTYRNLLRYGRGEVGQAWFYERYYNTTHNNKPVDVSLDSCISNLVRDMASSRNSLSVNLSYELPTGEWVALSLDFVGRYYEDGWIIRSSDHIRVWMSLRDLVRSLTSAPLGSTDLNRSRVELETQTITSVSELFLAVCGVLSEGSDSELIDHAGMYPESDWPTAVACSGVYHRDVREVARDFRRIYNEHHQGGYMPMSLDPTLAPEEWHMQVDRRWGRNSFPAGKDTNGYREFPKAKPTEIIYWRRIESPNDREPEGGALWDFLNSLTEAEVAKLETPPEPFLRTVLGEVPEAVPQVRYYDLGQRGVALTTFPLGSVWRVYALIRERAQSVH